MQGGLDCYQRAVAQYKLAGDWDTAADTLMKMGDIFRKQSDHVGAGRLYGDAGTCYRKYSATAAVNAYLKVIFSIFPPKNTICSNIHIFSLQRCTLN